MQLPGRLRGTTFGDLLGVLYRAGATGTLELTEDRGRTHRVHVVSGLVVAVELDGAAPSLADILRRERAADDDTLRRSLLRAMAAGRLHGDVLVREFRVSPTVVHQALRQQMLSRLSAIEALPDARVAFRVAVRAPRGALHDDPLGPVDFLRGRRRARHRGAADFPGDTDATASAAARAFDVLGIQPGTSGDEIKRAYRRLARTVHPDLHPHATDDERRALEARFAAITDAYRQLVA